MSFSEQLKAARIRAGLTQQQVADRLGVTKSTYCGYETAKRQPDVEKIKQLAVILGTSGDILLETGITDAQQSDEDVKVALFGGAGEVTDEMWDEVLRFVEFVKQKRKEKK